MKIKKPLITFLLICLTLAMSLTSCAEKGPAPIEDQTSGQTQEQSSDTGREETPDDNSTAAGDTSGNISESDGLISEDEAIAIVLARVDGAAAENIVSFRKEFDDGIWQYEGSLIYNGIEYEFEIDAQNGTLLDWEIDD